MQFSRQVYERTTTTRKRTQLNIGADAHLLRGTAQRECGISVKPALSRGWRLVRRREAQRGEEVATKATIVTGTGWFSSHEEVKALGGGGAPLKDLLQRQAIDIVIFV